MSDDSPLAGIKLEFVNTIDKAGEFKRWLGERRRVMGVDTESAGLKPEHDPLRMVQFGDLQTGWAIPWDQWGGVALEALNTYHEPLVMHNSPFDWRYLNLWAGVEPRWADTDDTMTKAHLVDPDRPKGLKPLASRLVDPRAVSGQAALDTAMSVHRWTWATVPIDFELYWVYAALDPVLTAHVDEHLDPIIKQRGYERAYDLERATTRICADMMTRGIQVDLEYCDSKSRELRERVRVAREEIKERFGITNATSNAQVIKRLTDDGIQLIKKTDSGAAFALDKEVLESLRGQHPLVDYIGWIRRAEKICGSYLEKFSKLIGPDGRIHTNINTLGARTGRMSLTDPALQTLHRDDPTVREAFVPREGHVFVSCDYDQIEARLAAHFSGDDGLISAFNADGDFFCTVASRIYNTNIIKGDPRRQITKNTVYGKIYGAGVETIARTAGVTPDVADTFIQSFDGLFPGISMLMTRVTNVAQHRRQVEGRAYVRTPMGREITTSTRGDRVYALLNYLIQGTAAEVLKCAMVELDALGLGEYLVLPIHDELVLEVPREMAQEVVYEVERVMSDLTSFRVPLTSSAVVFDERWGLKK